MITKTNAVKMSIRKWTALAKGEWPKSRVCGFCKFTRNHCTECPLYPDVGCETESLFMQWIHAPFGTESDAIAQQILDAIKERGAKWIKGGIIER